MDVVRKFEVVKQVAMLSSARSPLPYVEAWRLRTRFSPPPSPHPFPKDYPLPSPEAPYARPHTCPTPRSLSPTPRRHSPALPRLRGSSA